MKSGPFLFVGPWAAASKRSFKSATEFGPLDNFSAFKFESYLQKLKKLPTRSSGHFQQIGKRLLENLNFPEEYDLNLCNFIQLDNLNQSVFSKIKYKHFLLIANTFDNGVCLLQNNKAVFIKHFEFKNNEIFMQCNYFQNPTEFLPQNFKNIFHYYKYETRSSEIYSIKLNEFKTKCLCLNEANSVYIIPFIHECCEMCGN